MTSYLSSSWNYLSSKSPWNAEREVKALQAEHPQAGSNLFEKVKMGFLEGIKNIPRVMVGSACATAIIGMSFGFADAKALKECNARRIVTLAPSVIEKIVQIIGKAAGEEFIFRAGIQNALGCLQNCNKPILAALGSLKGRVALTSVLFTLAHLGSLTKECVPTQFVLAQMANVLLNANFSLIYESGGIAASVTAHAIQNLVPYILFG